MRKFRNILLVIEPGIDNRAAIDRAFGLATSNGAGLAIVSVVEEAPILKRAAPDLLDGLVAERTQELQTIASGWSGNARLQVLVGRPFLEIVRTVLQNGHDLVIKSKASSHYRFAALGSTDMHVFRKCPCPVWVVRSESGQCQRILAAVDVGREEREATALARRVLEIATSLAEVEKSQLSVTYAWSLPYEDTLRSPRSGLPQREVDRMAAEEEQLRTTRLEALLNEVAPSAKPSLLVKKGHPTDVIAELVEQSDIDLIIMGTVGRTGIPGFFIGNTAEEILGQIDCSVLAIKPPGFVSPVTIS